MHKQLNPVETPFLYHYTTVESFYKIIQGKPGVFSLKASSLNRLSDKTEYNLGKVYMSEILETNGLPNLSPKIPNVKKSNFSISLSIYNDSRYMWEMYGDNSRGVVLILDSKKLLKECSFIFHMQYISEDNINNLYESFNIKDNSIKGENYILEPEIQKSLDNLVAIHQLGNLPFDCKNNEGFEKHKYHEYHKEGEVRMLYPIDWITDKETIKKDDKGYCLLKDFSSNILTNVIVGPNNNDSNCISELEGLLGANNFPHVIVSKSNCKL